MNLRVVLVEPLYEGNVGSVARAMKNFGFHELALVNPCKIEDYGCAMASHARDVLQMSKNFSTLSGALEGANLVVGTTGKRLDEEQHHLRLHLRVPCLTPPLLAKKLQGKEGTVALLLGREDCGLNSNEIALCDMIVSIPTSEEYPVMNLSHSAAVLFYELSKISAAGTSTCSGMASGMGGGMGNVQMARRESLLLLQERARALLTEINYPEHKLDFSLLMLRRIFGRAELTEREARALLGIIKRIRWRIGHVEDAASPSSDKEPKEK